MSQPRKKAPKKKKATELPDDDAMRKLFPAKVMRAVNKEIDHKPAKKPSKKR